MDNRAIPPQLKALLLCGAGLLLAILAGWNIGSANYVSLMLAFATVGVGCIALFSGHFFWVLTIASSFLGGTFPILGGSFTPFQILMAVGVVRFFAEDIILRRAHFRLGKRFDLLLIAGFMGVLTLHALHDRFGMRFLGSSVWGGRNYVNVYVGLAAFFVVKSIGLKAKLWSKLPLLVLAVAMFDLLIAVITTVFPASIYKIYPFYSAVSTAGIAELITGNPVETARVGGFGNFGFILIVLVLASVSLRQILNPSNFYRLIALMVGTVAVLYGSFRSTVLNTLIVTFAAGIRDLKFKILLLLPFLALLLFGLSILNSEVIHLPKQVQRSLSFLPGKWDADMARDAAASNDFRTRTWAVWTQEYFPRHPWLGRGFGFRSQWAEPPIYKPTAVDYRQTVEVGNIHNGLLASLDAFGLVGTAFFVLWNLRLLLRTFRVPFERADHGGMVLRFIALYLAVSIISYWIGAQNVGSFLPQEFALAGVFLRLQHETELPPKATPASSTQEHSVTRSLATA
jgi:O-antigen ligase